MKIVVKGVMTVEDALASVRHGVDGIWVSNHGARQLDTTPATIEVLPDICRAVAGRVEVPHDTVLYDTSRHTTSYLITRHNTVQKFYARISLPSPYTTYPSYPIIPSLTHLLVLCYW